MNFIKQMIEEKKLEKEEEFKANCSRSMIYIESEITDLKNYINRLLTYKKYSLAENNESIYDWEYSLRCINNLYQDFMYDLELYQSEQRFYECNAKEIAYMLKKKKEYRAEFESIYNNFKRATKSFDFPERNRILTMMRVVFDFDNSKYTEMEKYRIIHR